MDTALRTKLSWQGGATVLSFPHRSDAGQQRETDRGYLHEPTGHTSAWQKTHKTLHLGTDTGQGRCQRLTFESELEKRRHL